MKCHNQNPAKRAAGELHEIIHSKSN